MKGFKKYFKEDDDVRKTISKLPKKHQALVKGYKFLFEPRNSLEGDKEHVGLITNYPKKVIKVSSSWRFPREHVVLHEIGHLVYEKYVRNTPLETEWATIAKNTKNKKKDENAEESFCHAYANHYIQFKITIFDHETWHKFIERLT